jgi:NAD(P)-dependent dehydrogenase (short-subunit alcohol dehydrogenase family)
MMLLSPLTELKLDDFDRMHRTNVRGTCVVSQQAARRVRAGGAIVNFSSSVAKIALTGYTAYAATKGAVDAMTLILAKELRGRDITVNAVAPGPTATPLFLDGKPQEVIDHLKSMPPLGGSGSRPISPKLLPSLPVRAAGSTVRSSTPTVGWSECALAKSSWAPASILPR